MDVSSADDTRATMYEMEKAMEKLSAKPAGVIKAVLRNSDR